MNPDDYPEDGELVVCTVKKVRDFGAFVTLDEYGNKEGFIHVSEVATGWIKYIRNYIREKQKVVCKVLGTDPRKGHIDLSLKTVSEKEKREKIKEWKNTHRGEKLFDIFCERYGKPRKVCEKAFGRKLKEVFYSYYNAMEAVVNEPDALKAAGFSGDWVPVFEEVARENIAPSHVEVSGVLHIYSYSPDAVNHMTSVFRKLERKFKGVNLSYLGAPRYRIMVRGENYKIAEKELAAAVDFIQKNLPKEFYFKLDRDR